MGVGEIPVDDNYKPVIGLWDDAGHQAVGARAKNVGTDSSTGAKYGDIGVNVEVTVAQVTGANIALTSPPATTNAGSDTTLTFASKANHWLIQNNTSANVYVGLDVAATTSSTLLVPGAIWREDIPVTSPHLYTAAAQNINGATGIVVLGWS